MFWYNLVSVVCACVRFYALPLLIGNFRFLLLIKAILEIHVWRTIVFKSWISNTLIFLYFQFSQHYFTWMQALLYFYEQSYAFLFFLTFAGKGLKYHWASGTWWAFYPKYIMVLQNSKIAKFQVWIPNTSWCLHAAAQEKAQQQIQARGLKISTYSLGIWNTLWRHIWTLHCSPMTNSMELLCVFKEIKDGG